MDYNNFIIMNTQFDNLLKHQKKAVAYNNDNQQRKIQGIQLKRPANQSFHQSVMISERNSSIRNLVNSSYFNSEDTVSRNGSFVMSNSSKVLPNIMITSQSKPNKKLITSQISLSQSNSQSKFRNHTIKSVSTQKQSPNKNVESPSMYNSQQGLEELLKKYIDTSFVQNLIVFTNKQWGRQQEILLKQKRFEALKNLIIQKTNEINSLVEDFMLMQYQKYHQRQRKMTISYLFKILSVVLKQYQSVFIQILKKIPEDKIVRQQTEIQELFGKLLEMYDPKYLSTTNSTEKMKQRNQLFAEGYNVKKNNLTASIVVKLKPYLDFINETERYLGAYQKEIYRIRNQLQSTQIQKGKISSLLKKKANFTPIEINYQKLKQLKDESKKEFFQDLQGNFISFHQEQHKKNDKTIKKLEKQIAELKNSLQTQRELIKKLRQEIENIKKSVPKKEDMGTQVYLLNQKSFQNNSYITSAPLFNFLQNVSTPFSFNEKITGSLINILSIDKILFDFEVIKHKTTLQSFAEFMMTWFLIRTGNKRSAQIFTKNFLYSVKQLRNRHKRFNIFSKICGFNGFRKKNVQQDLEYIFFQTQKAWYILIKFALIYRKRLNENPTGFHLFPPLQCESIFKVPLRKVYELVQQFLTQQGQQIPADLNNQIDYYAINEISKFKSHDEQFQKQQLQQIHILRQINFDIIVGFLIQYISRQKCLILQKFLRAVTMKQKQLGNVLGYSEFQSIYRKFYKERRAKIENIYSKICFFNQHDMMDIENAEPIIKAIIEDQSGSRGIFQQNQSLKMLILTQKTNVRGEKITPNINSYENFRERYYYEFYDFYNTTFFLEQMFRVLRGLIRKKLKQFIKNDEELEKFIQDKQPLQLQDQASQKKQQKKQEDDAEQDDQDEYSDEEKDKKEVENINNQAKNKDQGNKKSLLEAKIQEWNKIIVRIPHFSQKVLTIDQIVVHNMKRKEMIDGSQFAWRTLRDILVIISKE